jgi:hypothetical protein
MMRIHWIVGILTTGGGRNAPHQSCAVSRRG